jgi:hypothetical protein
MQIVEHCQAIYSFADRYGNALPCFFYPRAQQRFADMRVLCCAAAVQRENPAIQPPPAELQEMSQRAAEVVQLLESLRALTPYASSSSAHLRPPASISDRRPSGLGAPGQVEPTRPPKRPWEEIARDEDDEDEMPTGPGGEAAAAAAAAASAGATPKEGKSAAEADMELIRSKRASSAAATPQGQQKSKYRKRSVSRAVFRLGAAPLWMGRS